MNSLLAITMMVPFVVLIIGGFIYMFREDFEAMIFTIILTSGILGSLWGFIKGLAYFGILRG